MEKKEWLAQKYEETKSRPLSEVNQRSLLWEMVRSQTLDNFLGKKFGTLKRYGAEGAEAMMAFFQEAFSSAASGLWSGGGGEREGERKGREKGEWEGRKSRENDAWTMKIVEEEEQEKGRSKKEKKWGESI